MFPCIELESDGCSLGPASLPKREEAHVRSFDFKVRENALPGESLLEFVDDAVVLGQAGTAYPKENLVTGIESAIEGESIEFKPGLVPGTIEIGGAEFIRGDVNEDGAIDISDPLSTLAFLFSGPSPGCSDAADANDDGNIDIADPVSTLAYLFLGAEAPSRPHGKAGFDPTPDDIGC